MLMNKVDEGAACMCHTYTHAAALRVCLQRKFDNIRPFPFAASAIAINRAKKIKKKTFFVYFLYIYTYFFVAAAVG